MRISGFEARCQISMPVSSIQAETWARAIPIAWRLESGNNEDRAWPLFPAGFASIALSTQQQYLLFVYHFLFWPCQHSLLCYRPRPGIWFPPHSPEPGRVSPYQSINAMRLDARVALESLPQSSPRPCPRQTAYSGYLFVRYDTATLSPSFPVPTALPLDPLDEAVHLGS